MESEHTNEPVIVDVQFRYVVDCGVRYDVANGVVVETYDGGGDNESSDFAYLISVNGVEADTGEWDRYIEGLAGTVCDALEEQGIDRDGWQSITSSMWDAYGASGVLTARNSGALSWWPRSCSARGGATSRPIPPLTPCAPAWPASSTAPRLSD